MLNTKDKEEIRKIFRDELNNLLAQTSQSILQIYQEHKTKRTAGIQAFLTIRVILRPGGENMELSKEEVKEMYTKMELFINEYLKKELIDREIPSVENVSIVLGYKNTVNLVRHSKTLTWLTIGLIVIGIGMIALAIQQSNLWPFCLWS